MARTFAQLDALVSQLINGSTTHPGIALTHIHKAIRYQYKPADQAEIASETTEQSDTHLVVPLEASSVYVIRLVAYINSDDLSLGDFKHKLLVPSSTTGRHGSTLSLSDGTTLNAFSPGDAVGNAVPWTIGTLAEHAKLVVDCFIKTGVDAGVLIPQWAQRVSNATGFTVKNGTNLSYYKVGGA